MICGVGVAALTASLAGCVPPPPRPATTTRNAIPVSSVFQDKESYLAQHFTLTYLPKSVQDTVEQAGIAPVGFDRLHMTTQVTVQNTTTGAPTTFIASLLYENAGNGLVREISTLQRNGFDTSTLFVLSYRGLYSLRSQTFQSTATAWPPLLETKQITHYDTDFTTDHISYIYRGGLGGRPQMTSPMQVSCTAGKHYSASVLHANIGGNVREFNCQMQNSNGVLTSTTTYAYFEKYGLAIPISSKTPTNELSTTIQEFRAE
ncbi:hypothetical protein DWU98_07745 [Dyella monticola]|uniref:Uncharacterized protein n=2 Tax=Dyella monticola TaxID=1927958 RepID=A0A370X475_9GAMM|nr:hypothetical protein DWU98_07745 [Dyella monticola]